MARLLDKLQHRTRRFFPERIRIIPPLEAMDETVLAFLIQNKSLDVLDGLGDGDPLDAGLPPQLLHHLALLLDTRHFYRLSLVEVNQAI